jgi:pyruvate dehydrogenase E1 component alpha subunit
MEQYKLQDPLETSLAKLKNEFGVRDEEINTINERVKAEVEESVSFADQSPFPDDNQMYRDIYAQVDYPYIMD